MSNELQTTYLDGFTVYNLIQEDDDGANAGYVWRTSTSAFAAFVKLSVGDFDITTTESDDSGTYLGSMPQHVNCVEGTYIIKSYIQTGGSPVWADDIYIGSSKIIWSGGESGVELTAIDASGRVDVGEWLGTAVTTSSTSAKPEVDAYSISDDAAAANNAELAFDGTGFGFTGCTMPTVTTLTGHTAQTGDNFALIGTAGVSLTNLGGMSTGMKAEVNTEADAALSDVNLDHLMKNAVDSNADMSAEVPNGTVLSNLMSKTSDTSTYAVATDSLEGIYDGLVARTLVAASYFAPGSDTVANVTTVATLTGHTVQTGDSYARIGAAGVSLTDLGGMSTTMKGQVNAEVDTALNTAIIGSPTANSVNERVAAIDDKLPTESYLRGTDEADGSLSAADLASITTGVSGPGAYEVTLTIRTTGDATLSSVEVWINTSNVSTASIVKPLTTDVNGQVVFNLDYGTYYIFCQKSGYSFLENGTTNKITAAAGAVAFTLDLASDVSASGAGSYLDASFLTRSLTSLRENIDEPSTNAKYSDARLITRLEESYVEILGEINRNATQPVVATVTITYVTDTEKYLLPHTIVGGSIFAIYHQTTSGYKVFYDSRGRYSELGRQVWVDGQILNIQDNVLSSGDTLIVEYIPSGAANLNNGICTIDATGLLVTLPSGVNAGTLDTHNNAYAGSILRILRDSDSDYDYIQERTIVSYVNSTRVATLDLALSPNPNGSGGVTYYETAPPIFTALDTTIALHAAYKILSIEGNKTRAGELLKVYRNAIRTLRLSAFYSNLQDCNQMRSDSYRHPRRRRGY